MATHSSILAWEIPWIEEAGSRRSLTRREHTLEVFDNSICIPLRRTYQKHDLKDPDNRDSVLTHLEPDILECQVKWPLGRIITNKASGGDRIPAELFQILKDDGVKVLHSKCQQIWKTQQWLQDWKRSVFIPIPKKGNAKDIQKTVQLHSSHTPTK